MTGFSLVDNASTATLLLGSVAPIGGPHSGEDQFVTTTSPAHPLASMPVPHVVLDTNVFVGAGFNPRSHSAQLLDAVRDGRLRMVWDDATHEEVEHVLRRIPRLSWGAVAELFREQDRFDGETHPDRFGYVPDPTDRKFAALADAANVPLVTSDRGLLNTRGQAPFPILKPSEFALEE
jgi:predicted nucleic acid-binding protein